MPTTVTVSALAAIALLTATLAPTAEPREEDRKAVERAVLDYVEGVYEMKPEYIERSVHKDLAKIGYGRWEANAPYRELKMTQPQLVELSTQYNKDGRIAADAPKAIEVLDLLDQTAAVKLTAEWGIDYMHLAKIDGRWMILHVLWQTHP